MLLPRIIRIIRTWFDIQENIGTIIPDKRESESVVIG